MYGLTRGTVTLVCAAVAGFLIWLATQVGDSTNSGYWGVYGLIAGAGLVMALSQLLGGWTKWGLPRMSVNVFLIGFLPVLVAVGWVLLATQPDANWFRDHIRSWTGDIGIQGLVSDLGEYVSVLAFGLGLVFGYMFDTSAPATYGLFGRRRAEAVPAGATPPEDARLHASSARQLRATTARALTTAPPCATASAAGPTRSFVSRFIPPRRDEAGSTRTDRTGHERRPRRPMPEATRAPAGPVRRPGRAATAGVRAATRQARLEARPGPRDRPGGTSAPVCAARLTPRLVRAERHDQQVHEKRDHPAEDERRRA